MESNVVLPAPWGLTGEQLSARDRDADAIKAMIYGRNASQVINAKQR